MRFWANGKKFLKIYDYGNYRITSELNIVKLMNNLRNLKILIKHSFGNEP